MPTPVPSNELQPKPSTLPRICVADRERRCYELAGKGLFKDPSWTLVHGVAHRWNLGHAWLQKGAWIYDPVADRCLPASEYEATYEARAERRYSAKEAAELAVRTRHWGPWHGPWEGWQFPRSEHTGE